MFNKSLIQEFRDHVQVLEADNRRLGEYGALDAVQLKAKTEELHAELDSLANSIEGANEELRQVRSTIVETEDIAILQESPTSWTQRWRTRTHSRCSSRISAMPTARTAT